MRRFLRQNGLSIVWLGLFFVTFSTGQIISGRLEYNSDQREHDQAEVSLTQYLSTPHFVEATMENWESEFLQMGVYVLLTAWLVEKGSAESKPPEGDPKLDEDPRDHLRPHPRVAHSGHARHGLIYFRLNRVEVKL